MFNVNSKDPRTTSMTSLGVFTFNYKNISHLFLVFSSIHRKTPVLRPRPTTRANVEYFIKKVTLA